MNPVSNALSRLVVAWLRLLAMLPLPVLHLVGSFLAFLAGDVLRYRRRVILENLRNAFPEKGEREIRKIAGGFYAHLADVTVETIKLLRISDEELLRRCRISQEGQALLKDHFDEGGSLIGLLGHFGNWEWVPPVVSLSLPYPVIPAYRPLKNKVFDKLMLQIRGRYSHELVPKKMVGRAMLRYLRSEKPFIMGLIADQTPSPQTAYWTSFLSRDTPVYSGPEKLARSTNTPVFFVALRRERRGHYVLHVELMTKEAGKLPEGQLSALFMSLLEREIRQAPSHWLWSHRRWKHRREENS